MIKKERVRETKIVHPMSSVFLLSEQTAYKMIMTTKTLSLHYKTNNDETEREKQMKTSSEIESSSFSVY